MKEGKSNQKQPGSEVKTFSVPFTLDSTKEDITINPQTPSKPSKEKIINQALKCHSEGNISEAAKYYQYFINQGFKDFVVFSNYGTILKDLGKLKEAELLLNQAIEINSGFAVTHYNLGTILLDLGKLKEAEISTRKAIKIRPDFAEAHNNLGSILHNFCKPKEAEISYRRAIEINPNYAQAHYNLSFILLKQERFEEAWSKYEWRWKIKNIKTDLERKLRASQPEWRPKNKGKILLWGEQGIGDELLFCSLIPDFYGCVDKLIVRTDRRLIPLLRRTFGNKIEYIKKDEKINKKDFDYQIAMGSLPKVIRPSINSFKICKEFKINIDKTKSNEFKLRINKSTNKKIIGLSWRSISKKTNNKSLSLEELILGIYSPDICFVSLQYGDTKEEISKVKQKHNINISEVEEVDKFNDIDGLASLIKACDEIVSIGNVNAPLAGAIGVKGNILIPKVSIYHYGFNQTRSIWYPSLRLFKQKSFNNWKEPLMEIKAAIKI